MMGATDSTPAGRRTGPPVPPKPGSKSAVDAEVDNAVAIVGAAIAADNAKNYGEAFTLYEQAIRGFLDVMPRLPADAQAAVQQSLAGYLDRAEQLRAHRPGGPGGAAPPVVSPRNPGDDQPWRRMETPRAPPTTVAGAAVKRKSDKPATRGRTTGARGRTTGARGRTSTTGVRGRTSATGRGARAGGGVRSRSPAKPAGPTLTALEQEILEEQDEDKIKLTWDDIAGLEYAKEQLQEAVVLPSIRPDIYSGPLLAPPKGVLLFGPPGTGKTMLAKAVASQGGTRFLGLSASSITSKWVGEGEKRMKAVFTLAEKIQPCVIFIDEIDSLLTARSDGESDSSRRLKTEFMVRFEGVSSSPDARVFVLGATNRPWELDDAVLRRFPKRIMIPLPDGPTRERLLSMRLKGHKTTLTVREMANIVRSTDKYSSSDLSNLAKEAAQISVRRLGSRVLDMDKKDLPPITRDDFADALRCVRPSASMDVLRRTTAWANDYGTLGTKK